MEEPGGLVIGLGSGDNNERPKQVLSFSGWILEQKLNKELINTCPWQLWEGHTGTAQGLRAGGQKNWPHGRWGWLSLEMEGDEFQPGQASIPSSMVTPSHHSSPLLPPHIPTLLTRSTPTVSRWSHILFILPPNSPSNLTPFHLLPPLYSHLYTSPPISSKDPFFDVLSSNISLHPFTHPRSRDLPRFIVRVFFAEHVRYSVDYWEVVMIQTLRRPWHLLGRRGWVSWLSVVGGGGHWGQRALLNTAERVQERGAQQKAT